MSSPKPAPVQRATTFDDDVLQELPGLAERARRTDGTAPFSDDLASQARAATTTAALHTRGDDGSLTGVAFVGTQGSRRAGEVLVDPAHRGAGLGAAMVAELLHDPGPELWLWSHGDHPAASAIARHHSLDRARELLQLRRPLDAAPAVAGPRLPDGVTIRTFVVGQDEAAWLAVNNAVFSWHPEQGSLTLDDVRASEAEPWFDAAGFFLAVDAHDRVLGYHWTKVHPHDPSPAPDAPGHLAAQPVGEVYVLGVAEDARGLGLGAALTTVGLRHLAGLPGVSQVMLYVEGDNTAALKVYERTGFTRYATDVAYLAQ